MRCFQCHAAFGTNEVLASFPHGDWLAFDPRQGRLWLICPACRRWSLVPIEARWEAVDELEKQTHDAARLIAQTDNIALLEVDRLRIVRVGRAPRVEEAWWRFGQSLLARYRRAQKLTRRREALETAGEIAGRVAVLLASGLPLWREATSGLEHPWLGRARQKQFGHYAWRGSARCTCGAALHELLWDDRARWRIGLAQGTQECALQLPCPACDPGVLLVEGTEAAHVLRRVLAYENYVGATGKQIGYAAALIEDAGGPDRAVRGIAAAAKPLGRFISTERFALEIALHEANERTLAELEARELEARWREEEEIASIIDGELTPVPFLSGLLQRERSHA